MLRGGPDGFRPGIRRLHRDRIRTDMVTADLTGDGRAEAVSALGTGEYGTSPAWHERGAGAAPGTGTH